MRSRALEESGGIDDNGRYRRLNCCSATAILRRSGEKKLPGNQDKQQRQQKIPYQQQSEPRSCRKRGQFSGGVFELTEPPAKMAMSSFAAAVFANQPLTVMALVSRSDFRMTKTYLLGHKIISSSELSHNRLPVVAEYRRHFQINHKASPQYTLRLAIENQSDHNNTDLFACLQKYH